VAILKIIEYGNIPRFCPRRICPSTPLNVALFFGYPRAPFNGWEEKTWLLKMGVFFVWFLRFFYCFLVKIHDKVMTEIWF